MDTVPGLKVLSAVAVCRRYKNSDEILRLGPSAIVTWIGDCKENCNPTGKVVGSGHFKWVDDEVTCGFCRLANSVEIIIWNISYGIQVLITNGSTE